MRDSSTIYGKFAENIGPEKNPLQDAIFWRIHYETLAVHNWMLYYFNDYIDTWNVGICSCKNARAHYWNEGSYLLGIHAQDWQGDGVLS